MSFLVKWFTIKGNLVFMNNLYHKVAVASVVCTVLGFTLGASEEIKAATISLTPTIQFGIKTRLTRFNNPFYELSPRYDLVSNDSFRGSPAGSRLAEFNISSFFTAPNTIIKSAVFQDKISSFGGLQRPIILSIFGYIGNGTFESRKTNGIVEGINTKLKLLKRCGFGLRNLINFEIRALLLWHFPEKLAQ